MHAHPDSFGGVAGDKTKRQLASSSRVGVFNRVIVGVWFGASGSEFWFGAGAMFVFLALSILYPNDRLSGFSMATKTCRAAKLYQRPLNSMSGLSVLK